MHCPYCNSEGYEFLNMYLPVSLSALKTPIDTRLYPMTVEVCPGCGLGYNTSVLPDEKLHEIYDCYEYINPFEQIGHTKFEAIKAVIKKYAGKNDKIVEIGSSVGFLLNELHEMGYENISGIDPAPQSDIAIAKGFDVRKEYFTGNSYKNKVNIFVLSHVFEHFNDPFSIFKNMVEQLSDDGTIIIETPDFTGFHHQHLFFYTDVFYKNLADKLGINLVDIIKIDEHKSIIVVFSNNKKYTQAKGMDTASEVVRMAKTITGIRQEQLEKLLTFIDGKDSVYWWGTGSSAIVLISQLSDELLRSKDIHFIDGQKSREGYYIPRIARPVSHISALYGKNIDAMVVTSTFVREIKDTIEKNSIKAEKILFL